MIRGSDYGFFFLILSCDCLMWYSVAFVRVMIMRLLMSDQL